MIEKVVNASIDTRIPITPAILLDWKCDLIPMISFDEREKCGKSIIWSKNKDELHDFNEIRNEFGLERHSSKNHKKMRFYQHLKWTGMLNDC